MIEIDIKKKIFTSDGKLELCVNKQIEKKTFVTIFGESGVGKTTLLRILAGLTNPDEGRIVVDDKVWFDSTKKVNIPTEKRAIGFVFQDYTLFPNMSVYDNISFALPKQEKHRAMELLELIKLTDLKNRKPDALSGGQKQRVALARSLALRPSLLLLDEPLSALDLKMRSTLQDELISLHKYFETTTMLVSHDLGEIFKLSNRVLSIKKGQVVADGTPSEIFINNKLSSKFKVTGEVLAIEEAKFYSLITVVSGGEILKVMATKNEMEHIAIGSKVMIASKAFNPIIIPLELPIY